MKRELAEKIVDEVMNEDWLGNSCGWFGDICPQIHSECPHSEDVVPCRDCWIDAILKATKGD